MAPPTFAGLDNYARVLTDPDRLGPPADDGARASCSRSARQMVVGFLLALLFEKEFPGRRVLLMLVLTPMMLSFVAVGAFFRYYYEPTFGLLSQAVRAVHRRAATSCSRRRRGAIAGDHLRRRLDVVAVRHAAGAGRPRQRAEVSLRGGRDRPRLLVAQLLDHHLPLHPRPAAAGAAVPDHRGVQAVRRRVPDHRRRPRHLDRDHRASTSTAWPSSTSGPASPRRSPTSCCSS